MKTWLYGGLQDIEDFVRSSKHGDQLWSKGDFRHLLALNAYGIIIAYEIPIIYDMIYLLSEFLDKSCLATQGSYPPPSGVLAEAEFLANLRGI